MRESRHIFHIHEVSPSRFEGEAFLGSHPILSDDGSSRSSHLEWVLSSQGEFLDLHRKSSEAIMNADGPLPVSWRHYIAMLGAAAYSCEYLVRSQLELFLASDGDPLWLTEPDSVPRKLQCLGQLSDVMAYRPWELDSSHIEAVTVCGRWSASELVHALLILASFHALPSLVFGSGIRIEDDMTLSDETCHCSTGLADALLESEPVWEEVSPLPRCFSLTDAAPSLLQRLLQQSGAANPASTRSISSSVEEPIAAFEGFGALNENVLSGSASPVSVAPSVRQGSTTRTAGRLGDEEKEELANIMSAQPKWRAVVSNILNKRGSEYRDFAQKTDRILHSMSFSWEDHGMMVLSRQMPEATDRIHDEHMHSLEFTSNSIGGRPIESTTTVREAIVKYVQRMYGVFHDDYKYDQLNKILPVIHKAYLKKLACYPDRITKTDYLRMRKFEGFTSLDLIHYAHLVSQTKRIVELTWAMRAVMTFQGGHHAE